MRNFASACAPTVFGPTVFGPTVEKGALYGAATPKVSVGIVQFLVRAGKKPPTNISANIPGG